MSEFVVTTTVCPRCGGIVPAGEMACPVCGQLVHVARLTELSQQAQTVEPQDARAAANIWRQCLTLLPPQSPQAQLLQRRIAALETGRPPRQAQWGWKSALQRTGGSMIVSILAYSLLLGWPFAAGFVLLILIHEMGHVIALRRYGVASSPPLFIPFVGAVITVPRMRDAKEEAIVGIGGPILGTIGALGCFGLYLALHRPILLDLSFYGFSMNLLNLLPIPPLDGGRITAAVSPWIWPLGFAALLALGVAQFVHGNYDIASVSPVLVLIIIFAAPRLWRTFRYRERSASYYRISRQASWTIGLMYVALAGLLGVMAFHAKSLGAG